MLSLSPQQQEAADKVLDWYRSPKRAPVFRLFGYAGTGKTTTIKYIVERLGGRVEYVAFTGKAASVMRQYGVPTARTLHSLIYKFEGEDLVTREPKFSLIEEEHYYDDTGVRHTHDVYMADLIVLDECSMVGGQMAKDLLSFNKPILVIGDPAQLPPVNPGESFTDGAPDAMLTEVHRQAQQSPVLQMATTVRMGGRVRPGTYGDSKVTFKAGYSDADLWGGSAQVLVAKNTTRKSLNAKARKYMGFSHPYPMFGERIICLRNNRRLGIFNGEMFVVSACAPVGSTAWLEMTLIRDAADEGVDPILHNVQVHSEFFTTDHKDIKDYIREKSNHFDFAYAITVHKSQGSQWEDVLVYDEDWPFGKDKDRWLYTAITRAKKTVTLLV